MNTTRTSAAALRLRDATAEIENLVALGVPVSRIADRFCVSRPTLVAFLSANAEEKQTNLILEAN